MSIYFYIYFVFYWFSYIVKCLKFRHGKWRSKPNNIPISFSEKPINPTHTTGLIDRHKRYDPIHRVVYTVGAVAVAMRHGRTPYPV